MPKDGYYYIGARNVYVLDGLPMGTNLARDYLVRHVGISVKEAMDFMKEMRMNNAIPFQSGNVPHWFDQTCE